MNTKGLEDKLISKKVYNSVLQIAVNNTENEFSHREFNESFFWHKIPEFKTVTEAEFMTTKFQNKNTVTSLKKLREKIEPITTEAFLEDVEQGMKAAPMNLRITPYILSLIDWSSPYNDPLRLQFVPLNSDRIKDHPKLQLDSLGEQKDSPVEGLVHRYKDKVLFLPLDVCPVYCRFCTRSYAIGGNTESVGKVKFKPIPAKWEKAFEYIKNQTEVEDVVISGGDAYMLTADRIKLIGESLLAIPHVRRLRFASKGPAVMPMKILSDTVWTQALIDVVSLGRELGKEVVLHTHFNSTKEITKITKDAMLYLFKNGVKVRNQSVLIKGVNDSAEEMIRLVKKLSYMNVQPYYVYLHDMVKGVEDMRTTLHEAIEIEKKVRGITAGFNTPLFVMDAPGGGGKRDMHSYEYYDKVTGISIYKSPSVNSEKLYFYYDPISQLPKRGQALWEEKQSSSHLLEKVVSDYKKAKVSN